MRAKKLSKKIYLWKKMKRRIRLTESQLHRVIKESVHKVLNENCYDYIPKQGTNHGGWHGGYWSEEQLPDSWDGGFGDNWTDEQWSEYKKKRAEKYKDMPNRDYFMDINESVKGGDMENVVLQSVAENFGFEPEYSLGNGIELWGTNLRKVDLYPQELLKVLGIPKFTTYNINGHVRITVKCRNKMNAFSKFKPYNNDNGWNVQYHDNSGYKILRKGRGANKQWKRERVNKS